MSLDSKLRNAAREVRAATSGLDAPDLRHRRMRRAVGGALTLAGAAAVIVLAVVLVRPDSRPVVPATDPVATVPTTPVEVPGEVELLPLGPEPSFELSGSVIDVPFREPTSAQVAEALAQSGIDPTDYVVAGVVGDDVVLAGTHPDDGLCVVAAGPVEGRRYCGGSIDNLVALGLEAGVGSPEQSSTASSALVRGSAIGGVVEQIALVTWEVGDVTYAQRPRGGVVYLPATFALRDTPVVRTYLSTGAVQTSVEVDGHRTIVAEMVQDLLLDLREYQGELSGTPDASRVASFRGRHTELDQLVAQFPADLRAAAREPLSDAGKILFDLETRLAPTEATELVLPVAGDDPTEYLEFGNAQAIDVHDQVVWVATGWVQRGQDPATPPLILAVNPMTGLIMQVYELSAPMQVIDAGTEHVWFGRVGDGGEPSDVIGRIDLGSGEVLEAALPSGIRGIVADESRAFVIEGENRGRVVEFSADLTVASEVQVSDEHLQSVSRDGDRLLLGDVTGAIYGVAVSDGSVSLVGSTGAFLQEVLRAGDHIWALVTDEAGAAVMALTVAGERQAVYAPPGQVIVDIVSSAGSPDVFAITERGAVIYVPSAASPEQVARTERPVSSRRAAAFAGVELWIATEIGLERVSLGQ